MITPPALLNFSHNRLDESVEALVISKTITKCLIKLLVENIKPVYLNTILKLKKKGFINVNFDLVLLKVSVIVKTI